MEKKRKDSDFDEELSPDLKRPRVSHPYTWLSTELPERIQFFKNLIRIDKDMPSPSPFGTDVATKRLQYEDFVKRKCPDRVFTPEMEEVVLTELIGLGLDPTEYRITIGYLIEKFKAHTDNDEGIKQIEAEFSAFQSWEIVGVELPLQDGQTGEYHMQYWNFLTKLGCHSIFEIKSLRMERINHERSQPLRELQQREEQNAWIRMWDNLRITPAAAARERGGGGGLGGRSGPGSGRDGHGLASTHLRSSSRK